MKPRREEPLPSPDPEDYRVVLDTDAREFGGHGRCEEGVVYPRQQAPMYSRGQSIQIYLPSRSAQVLAPEGLLRAPNASDVAAA